MLNSLRVVAHLSSPLCGEPPQLDALLTFMAAELGDAKAVPYHEFIAGKRRPAGDDIDIGIGRRESCGFMVPLCTGPIMDAAQFDRHDYIHKRIATEFAEWLRINERVVVITNGFWTKARRLPMRVRNVSKIVWLVRGNADRIRELTRLAKFIGKGHSQGYGQVDQWEIEPLPDGDSIVPEWPWWIDGEFGPVLMRAIPKKTPGVPTYIAGAKAGFGSCRDPYWDAANYGEILAPC